MKFYIVLLLAFLSGTSCASKKKAMNDTTNQLKPILELTKTPCFGRCPTFTLTIHDNGLAVLDGKQNLKHIGLYHKMLDKNDMKSLQKVCDDGALFSLKDSYEQKIMDFPTTTIKYTADGKTKIITGNKDFPNGFKNVVSHCMTIVEAEGWELKEAYNTK